ncbi:imelysin family protein [Mesorhizobium sp. WSM2239]|uniref:Imelysin family protein n=2 Tax=unclassified Mesorhizobium TaxID=325217 RepID=A0AAU8D8R8_9HYPH
MKLVLLPFLAIAFALCGPARANPVIPDVIAGFVRPAYETFHSASSKLGGDMDALCAKPSAERLSAAERAFLAAVTAWSEVEIIRFGPATEENRLERILFWPDRKSIGLKQVQRALAEEDASAADPATLAGKSVAMQGLGALEFILFGTGAEGLVEPGGAYRCAYGRAIAANLQGMAAAILAGWQSPDGIARQWANPGADNSLYRTDGEALTELLDIFIHGFEMVRDVRLNGFLGEEADGDKPKQAIFWRSGATLASIDANLRGLRKLFEASGFSSLLPQDSAWIADSVGFEFANAGRALDMDGPIAEILADPAQREKLAYARLVTSSLSELFGAKLTAALGLTAGFSSLDGD